MAETKDIHAKLAARQLLCSIKTEIINLGKSVLDREHRGDNQHRTPQYEVILTKEFLCNANRKPKYGYTASLVVISPGSTERVVRWSGRPRDDDVAAIEDLLEKARGVVNASTPVLTARKLATSRH